MSGLRSNPYEALYRKTDWGRQWLAIDHVFYGPFPGDFIVAKQTAQFFRNARARCWEKTTLIRPKLLGFWLRVMASKLCHLRLTEVTRIRLARIKITPRLSNIHLSLLVKSSRVLSGWQLNKWLRLTDPQPETRGGQRKTTLLMSHDTMTSQVIRNLPPCRILHLQLYTISL